MSWISHEALDAYIEAFPGDDCGYEEPSDLVSVGNSESDDAYLQPWEETESVFLDRIARSKKAGRNLFYEEWPRLEYKEGCLY